MRSRNLGWAAAALVCLVIGGAGAEEQKSQPEKDSGKPAPAKVGEEAKILLETKITLRVVKMELGRTLAWAKRLAESPLLVFASKEAAKKKVSLEFIDAPLAEVLRKITEQTGAVYRFDNGRIEIVTPDEKKALDAGKGTFEAWKFEDEEKEAVADSGKPEPQKVGDEAQLLLRKVTLEMADVPLSEAIEFMNEFVKVDVSVSKGAGAKPVTLKLQNATLAEALRQIKDQAGAVHRVVDGKLLIASPEEWKEIDAGTAKFEAYKSAAAKP